MDFRHIYSAEDYYSFSYETWVSYFQFADRLDGLVSIWQDRDISGIK
jgi:hypothetical protein